MKQNIVLTDQQKEAVEKATSAVRKGIPLYKIGGYAGTGKTTVARHIVDELGSVLSCAYTGKAACRLRNSGLDYATTIHSTIYTYDRKLDIFVRKSTVEGQYFLIDEGSMVGTKVWKDLKTFGKPIILIGDPGQLEPVGDDPMLMKNADIVLDKIHRQAEQSGIIQYATDIRTNRYKQGNEYPDVEIVHGRGPSTDALEWADVIICGYNRTRLALNNYIRSSRGYKGLLNPGERIIVLKNNPEVGVFNGQMLEVININKKTKANIEITCRTEDDGILDITCYTTQFGNKPSGYIPKQGDKRVFADYGYCITCHKSQGSEWDKVLVVDEQYPKFWDATRWRYTAVTRTAKELRHYYRC